MSSAHGRSHSHISPRTGSSFSSQEREDENHADNLARDIEEDNAQSARKKVRGKEERGEKRRAGEEDREAQLSKRGRTGPCRGMCTSSCPGRI